MHSSAEEIRSFISFLGCTLAEVHPICGTIAEQPGCEGLVVHRERLRTGLESQAAAPGSPQETTPLMSTQEFLAPGPLANDTLARFLDLPDDFFLQTSSIVTPCTPTLPDDSLPSTVIDGVNSESEYDYEVCGDSDFDMDTPICQPPLCKKRRTY